MFSLHVDPIIFAAHTAPAPAAAHDLPTMPVADADEWQDSICLCRTGDYSILELLNERRRATSDLSPTPEGRTC